MYAMPPSSPRSGNLGKNNLLHVGLLDLSFYPGLMKLAVPMLMLSLVLAFAACETNEGQPKTISSPNFTLEEEFSYSPIAFPTQRSGASSLDALVGGRLVVAGHCLYAEGRSARHRVLPLWPEGFTYEERSRTILDAEGRAIARVGDTVVGSGGRLDKEATGAAEDLTGDSLEMCSGPYWMVGSELQVKKANS